LSLRSNTEQAWVHKVIDILLERHNGARHADDHNKDAHEQGAIKVQVE
jgi:hypothetical protein